MQYKYLAPNVTEKEILDRHWQEIRWDFSMVFKYLITKACDYMVQPTGRDGEDAWFTVTVPEPLTEEQQAWFADHFQHKERWGTLQFPVNGMVNIDPEYIAMVLKKETNNVCFFRGFHGQAINIGCERELTDAEKEALKPLGDIRWS